MMFNNVRTDLALEARNAFSGELEGAELTEREIGGIRLTELNVSSQRAADMLCKPLGKYLTLELDSFIKRRETSFAALANAAADCLRSFEAVRSSKSVLVACLGNRQITPDAVGSLTADSVIVTRHLKATLPDEFSAFSSVAVLRTGVLGTTGIESMDTLKAVCDLIKPDCVIAVDALASSDMSRLCRTVQICDSGIAPGSGVGNNRAQLNHESIGVPVIAMGVPTVIDAAAFTDSEDAKGLFVTPRNIDELAASVSKLMAYAINLALHPSLTVEDIDLLIE